MAQNGVEILVVYFRKNGFIDQVCVEKFIGKRAICVNNLANDIFEKDNRKFAGIVIDLRSGPRREPFDPDLTLRALHQKFIRKLVQNAVDRSGS